MEKASSHDHKHKDKDHKHKDHDHKHRNRDNEYDFIICGGYGNAGAVLAARLTENPNVRVLAIDSGRDDVRLPQLLPEDLPDPYPNKETNKWGTLSRTGPLATYGTLNRTGFAAWNHLGKTRDTPEGLGVFLSRGVTAGGSTAHNAGVYVRGSGQLWDQWPRGWKYNDVLPYFKKAENRIQTTATFANEPYYQDVPTKPWVGQPGTPTTGVLGSFDPKYENRNGKVHLAYFDEPDAFQAALNTSAVALGFKVNYDDSQFPYEDEGFTNLDETMYDQYSSTFAAINPYSDGQATFPDSPEWRRIGLAGVAPRYQRESSATAYLYPIECKRKNLTIIPESLVAKVIIKDDKAIGIKYLHGWNIYDAGRNINTGEGGLGGTPADAELNAIKAKAKGYKYAYVNDGGEVILSLGTFNTPQTLLLSGIGDSEELKKFGIKVKKHLPGVGKHYVDHQEFDVFWEFNEAQTLPVYNILALLGTGHSPRSSLITLTFKSRPQYTYSDLHAHVIPGGILTGMSGLGDLPEAVVQYPGFPGPIPGNARYNGPPRYIHPRDEWLEPPANVLTHGSALFEKIGEVKSEGYVTLNTGTKDKPKDPRDPTNAVKIITNYWIVQQDLDDIIDGFINTFAPFIQNLPNGFFRRWVAPAPQDWLLPNTGDVLLPDKSNFNRAAFEQFIIHRTWSHHASGTCKMQESKHDSKAVVDRKLRVIGIKNLRVVDCSIAPVIPNANTQAPAYMYAEKAADLIKKAHKDKYFK